MRILRTTTLLPGWAILWGCALLACASATGPGRDVVPTTAAGSANPPAELPSAVRDALLPPLDVARPEAYAEVPAAQVPYPNVGAYPEASDEQRFDVAVHDVPVRSFFMNLVEGTPYDVVIHPEVSGRLSLALRNVSVPEVMNTVREVYGYGHRKMSGGYQVLPAAIQSRIFQVDYLHIARGGLSQTRVSGGQLSERFNDGGSSQSMGGLGPITTGNERSLNVIESTMVRTDSDMEFWVELEESLQVLVGPGEGRSVVVAPQAGLVVVRALPEELRQVEEFLGNTQTNVDRQVVLEATILEVDLDDGYRAGVNWAALIESGSKSALFGQTGGGSFFEDGVSDIAGNLGILDPRNLSLPSNTDTSAYGGVFSAALDLNDFTAFIELVETQGDVHVLSRPTISTMNNQKAVIKIGSDEFFVTDVSTTTVTGTVATTSPDVTLTPFFSGIALDVLPQIAADGSVTLHVHPSISNVQDQTKTISLGDDDLTLPLAFSTIRESDTIVRARSGQTVVIGGLMQETAANRRASLPGMGRIPWIGDFFGQREEGGRKSELVILLRPRVIDEDGWEPELRRAERRLDGPEMGPRVRRLLDNEGWSPLQ